MSSFDNIVEEWADNENVLIFQSLGDLNQPYSCEQWGNVASLGSPLITDDTGSPIFGMFNTDNLLPSAVYIDHTMTVHYKQAGHDTESAINNRIQTMLDNLYGAPIVTANPEVQLNNDYDDDGVLNPGEGFKVTYTFTNNSFETDALNSIATLSIDEGGSIVGQSEINIGDIAIGQTITGEFSILLDDNVSFGDYDIDLQLVSNYINNSGDIATYTKDASLTVDVSLNQFGFPISTAEIRSSPLVIDFYGDGNLEIIVGDNNGFVRIYNIDGSEIIDGVFPYDTGNQIWGSPAGADMDGDGNIDFVITSKSKHLYIFDKFGLKVDYNANKFLMGTPSIGNLDDDEDLEVVVGGYSSNNQIFVINPDGTNVEGFPFDLGEKTKAAVALGDFNGNGIDDIIVGTDDDNIYVIYDDATFAPGFPFTATDKIQAAPSVYADSDGMIAILSGSNDNSFYVINDDGSLNFSIPTGGKVQSSPSILLHNNKNYIFFGSDDNMIYAVSTDGEMLEGWPVLVSGSISGSIVFSDLDNDGDPEVIGATNTGDLLAFHIDGNQYEYFPILNDFPFSGSPMVVDLDNDGDLEILTGSGSNLFIVDIKSSGSTEGYWNVFRESSSRNGCRFYTLDNMDCGVSLGDVSGDGGINILDLVQIANYILGTSIPLYECAADFTMDQNINILDLVQIANFILEN